MRMTALAVAALTTAAPALADQVNVYSYRQPELIQPLFDVFTEKTGIEVNVAFLNKGMAERLKAEGARSPADLAFTVDIGRLDALKSADVLDPLVTDAIKANVPEQYRDPDGEWTALTTRARIVYASKERVADGQVTTYEDLADPKWKGKICTRSGTHVYMLALTAGIIEQHGEEYARNWLAGLKANLARKPQGNDRAQVKAIWAGECDISIGNTYYMALMMKNEEQMAWADSVRIVFPTFENGGTHVNVSGVALTKASPNRDAAIQLVEFLASEEGQRLYAEINSEYPVNPNVSALAVVEAFGKFSADDANLQTIANFRDEALRITEEVDYDG